MRKKFWLIAFMFSFLMIFTGCNNNTSPYADIKKNEVTKGKTDKLEYNIASVKTTKKFDLKSVPKYSNKPYVIVNNNMPYFEQNDMTTESFEKYSSLDSLGRCGVAFCNVGVDIMPTKERGSIGMIKPSGWHTVKYDNVDGKYLYNRCHLIAFMLSGENANEKNLITGTRYMNVDGMNQFEIKVADYVKRTNNHVLYRVTPIFEEKNLLATGVLMEAFSVEDNGKGICFNVFCYNEQPGISIDHSNGDSKAIEKEKKEEKQKNEPKEISYIANKNTKKFHYPFCQAVGNMKEKNKKQLKCTREQAIQQGYSPCGICKP